jgi:hypothetical protein
MITSVNDTFRAVIYLAGDLDDIRRTCRRYCTDVGLCVTVTATEFIYTGGSEQGAAIGLLNYPRFPSTAEGILDKARELGHLAAKDACQKSFLICADGITEWYKLDVPAAKTDEDNQPVICRECGDETENQSGICDDCDREECPDCDGTGMSPNYDDEEDCDSNCEFCGGDGVI